MSAEVFMTELSAMEAHAELLDISCGLYNERFRKTYGHQFSADTQPGALEQHAKKKKKNVLSIVVDHCLAEESKMVVVNIVFWRSWCSTSLSLLLLRQIPPHMITQSDFQRR